MQEFKEKVRNHIIDKAELFKKIYVDYDYLIYSNEFDVNKYYILSVRDYNYLHLTGVKTKLKAEEFFCKSLDGTLCTDDFWIGENDVKDKNAKGTVKRKMKAMDKITQQFGLNVKFEENFEKKQVRCSIASTDGTYTLGFVANEKFECKAKTLLKGDETKNAKRVLLVFRKLRKEDKFNELLLDNRSEKVLIEEIKDLITQDLLNY